MRSGTSSPSPLQDLYLAFNNNNNNHDQNTYASQIKSREFLSDRKGLFDHLRLCNLLRSTIRVTLLQLSQSFAFYLNEQIEAMKKTDYFISHGKVKFEEVKIGNILREKKDWSNLLRKLPTKVINGILRFQCVTVTMRLYEWFVADVLVVTDKTIDKLTKDIFNSAIRKHERFGDRNRTYDKNKMMWKMFNTCLWANSISFLADLTVQLLIHFCRYYLYSKKKERLLEYQPNQHVIEYKSNRWLFWFKFLRISISRTFSFMTACVGGAIGSSLHPGWGTLLGVQIGDSIISIFP